MDFKGDAGRPASSEMQLSTLGVTKEWATDFDASFDKYYSWQRSKHYEQ